MTGEELWGRDNLDSLAQTSPWLPLTAVLGSATLTTFSVFQKLQIGVPVTNVRGFLVPVLFGGFFGLAVGYVYRERAIHLESLREEIGVRQEKGRELERYRQAVESSTNLLIGMDREYTVLFANGAYRQFHGISEADDTEYSLRDVIGEADFEAVKPYVDRALEGEKCEFEISRERVDGETRQFLVRNYPLVDEGDITGVVTAMNDVTERREHQRELLAQKQRYESLFESIRDAIVVADTEGAIVNANTAFKTLFDYDFADVEGADISILYADDSEFDAAAARRNAASTDGPSKTRRYRKRSGQVFEGEERLFPLREPDEGITGYVAIVRDVSGRETRLQQLRVLERVFRHNINNDMNVIAGYAETIRDVAAEPVSEYAETILEKSEALVDTADKERQITAHLSRSPSTEQRELRSTIRETVEWARERYPEADIATDVPDTCTAAAGDGIGTAIEELIDNAIVHSDRKEPSVRVSIEVGEDVVEVIVADDGPGIPEMERSVLTDEADIDPLYHGSGLGLWLVNLIVRQSDGVLSFEENDPRGSVVTITLPRERPRTGVESPEQESRQSGRS